MNDFNKHDFLIELEKEIQNEIKNGNIYDNGSLQEFIENEIDTATIYDDDCWDICKQLSSSRFTEYGSDIETVKQLATIVLTDYVYDNVIFDYDVRMANQQ